MQDPSYGVAQQLQNHVHLTSGHRFPILHSLSLQQAHAYLLDAPTIVKQTAPMSWTYLNAPQDGTVFLEWISRANGEQRFPSDGYVWADPEQTYRQDFNGYTVEMLVHTVGFRPNFDQMATHARTRYHFIHKAPSLNAPPPDPSLWIVHYHRTDPHMVLDVRQIPIPHPTRVMMQERQWLEKQGRLEKKDFMLHDRDHWPQISVPNSMQQMPQHGMYGQGMTPQQQMMLQQQRGYPSQTNYPMQQPPAKRARHSGPSGAAGSISEGHDNSIEEEENTGLGDFFDHLSPREISSVRFMQHHRWMEEVFSSPYASARIVPPDLGMGLMGTLKGLTEGILDPPSVEAITKDSEAAERAKEAQPFTNLKKEQIDEFGKRVEKHLEEGQAEIERMKREHAEKMAEWKKSSMVLQAEKRLRYATWEGHESAAPAYRLEGPPTNGHAEEGAGKETVEQIVADVEKTLGVKVEGGNEATLVEKGGLEREEAQQRVSDDMGMGGQDMNDFQQQDAMMSGANNMSGQQQDYGQQQYQMQADTSQQYSMPQQSMSAQQQYGQSTPQPQQPNQGLMSGNNNNNNNNNGMGGMSMNMGDDSLMDDMNMDVDVGQGDIDFIEHSPQTGDNEGAPTPLAGDTPAQAASTTQAAPSQTGTPLTLGETGQQSAPSNQPTPQPPTDPSAPAPAAQTVSQPDEASAHLSTNPDPKSLDQGQEDSTTNLFDDGTFDDLANMGDGGVGGDDGLLDFDGLGDGEGESAFAEAMHGTDTGTPGNEGGA
ncbi:uncharacterized protein LTR77_006034 [Saxophila tyrrhenica]|uniref:DUF1750-domain-containing protein n=1 Tax=Saxophila tyrrhenica TaxID=1690608 RepID=A0AAV9PAX5_9PEZI|nr:hypothetical protein LTR77_006034 [Saxophila tyrrhenica]